MDYTGNYIDNSENSADMEVFKVVLKNYRDAFFNKEENDVNKNIVS